MDWLVRGQTASKFPNRSGGVGNADKKLAISMRIWLVWRPVGDFAELEISTG